MNNQNRRYILLAIFISVAVIYIIRLAQLQLLDESYIRSAQANVLQEQTIYPARGLVYDRNGELLVYNDAIYDLSVIPEQVKPGYGYFLQNARDNKRGFSGTLYKNKTKCRLRTLSSGFIRTSVNYTYLCSVSGTTV